jgi:Protein of unknown function (DUF2905)
MLPQMGKLLMIIGVVFIGIGLLVTLLSQFPFLRFGKLPGDIYIKRDNFTFYFPLTTSILLSVLLSLIFFLLSRK